MSDPAVTVLDEYRMRNGIKHLLAQPWPTSKSKDFRVAERERSEEQLRTVYCGFCGTKSPELDGPTGRAWFASHECKVPR